MITVHYYNLRNFSTQIEQKCKDLLKFLKVIKEIEEKNKNTPISVINFESYVYNCFVIDIYTLFVTILLNLVS